MVLSDWRIKMREIVEATGISRGTVFSILQEKLDVKKILARWMPRLLSEKINAIYGRNRDAPLHSRVKITFKSVGYWRRTGSEEGKNTVIGRQGDGHGFLGCTRNHLHRLFGKRTNDNWSVLCIIIAPVDQRNQEKTSSIEKLKKKFNHYNIHCIHRIWPPVTFFCIQSWKNSSADNGSRRTMRISTKQMPILRTFRNPTFWTA